MWRSRIRWEFEWVRTKERPEGLSFVWYKFYCKRHNADVVRLIALLVLIF